jgi:hypothetical protein
LQYSGLPPSSHLSGSQCRRLRNQRIPD